MVNPELFMVGAFLAVWLVPLALAVRWEIRLARLQRTASGDAQGWSL